MNEDYVVPPVYYLDETTGGTALPPQSFPETVPPVSTPAIDVPLTTSPADIHNGFFGGAMEGLNNFTVMELAQLFIVYAFIIAGALSAVFIFVGGVSFILSGGNDEKIRTAVNTIRYAIVGLIITILSFTFVMIVGRIFGLNLLDYISYEQIKISINRLIEFGESPVDTTRNRISVPTLPTR